MYVEDFPRMVISFQLSDLLNHVPGMHVVEVTQSLKPVDGSKAIYEDARNCHGPNVQDH